MTISSQLLDFRIFGSHKAKVRAAFTRSDIITHEGNEQTINWPLTINVLLECWEIINAWSDLDKDITSYGNEDALEYVEAEEYNEEELSDFEEERF